MYSVDRNEADEWGGGAVIGGMVGAGIGALIGWGIDAARSRPTFTYRAGSARTAQVSVGPMLSRDIVGLGVSVRF